MSLRDVLALVPWAALSVLLFLAGALVPFVGPQILLLAPLPLLSCSVGFRYAAWRAAVAAVLAAGLLALPGGWPAGAGYFVTIGAAAIGMSYLIERRQPFERVIAGATLLIIAGCLGIAIAYAGSPEALVHALRASLTSGVDRWQKVYSTLGVQITPEFRTEAIDITLMMMPALTVIGTALIVLLNLALFWRWGGRQQRTGYMLFGELARWSTPEWLVWVLLATGFGWFIPVPALATIALNCFAVVAAIYFCQGLAIMSFYFRVLAMPILARLLIYLIVIVQPFLPVLLCVAGILDLWVDFRRLKPPSTEARNLGDFL